MRQTGADVQSKYKETSLGALAVNLVEYGGGVLGVEDILQLLSSAPRPASETSRRFSRDVYLAVHSGGRPASRDEDPSSSKSETTLPLFRPEPRFDI
jgi:hypothetical protein